MTRLPASRDPADADAGGETDAAEPSRRRIARRVTAYAAIVGTLPYLTLKFAWLTGNDIGVVDPAFMRDAGIYWLNVFTAGMDVYAILLALAFAHAWGQRMPAPLVLFPVWVGTGFLAPIVAGFPVVGVVVAVAGAGDSGGGGPALPLAPWVQPLVYGGFAWQGVFLLTAFLLYARMRWHRVFSVRLGAAVRQSAAGSTTGRWALLGYTGATLAALTAAAHVARPFTQAGVQPPTVYAVEAIHGVAALLGAAGVLMLAHRMPARWRLWAPAALGWTGAGAMFSWGFWGLVNSVGATLLAQQTSAAQLTVTAVQTLGGLLLIAAVLGHTSRRSTGFSDPAGGRGGTRS